MTTHPARLDLARPREPIALRVPTRDRSDEAVGDAAPRRRRGLAGLGDALTVTVGGRFDHFVL